jgi:hypothetical protein
VQIKSSGTKLIEEIADGAAALATLLLRANDSLKDFIKAPNTSATKHWKGYSTDPVVDDPEVIVDYIASTRRQSIQDLLASVQLFRQRAEHHAGDEYSVHRRLDRLQDSKEEAQAQLEWFAVNTDLFVPGQGFALVPAPVVPGIAPEVPEEL